MFPNAAAWDRADGDQSIGHAGVLLFSASVWGGALLHAAMPSEAGFVILRAVLTAMVVIWSLAIFRSRKPILLISPWFVMSAVALFGYSLVEILYVRFPDAVPYTAAFRPLILPYPGGVGEALVLQFVAFALLLTAAIFRFFPGKDLAMQAPKDERWERLGGAAVVGLLSLLAADQLIAWTPGVKQLASAGIGKQLADSIEPLTALGFALLAFLAGAHRGIFAFLLIGMAGLYLAVKVSTGLVQTPVFIVTMALGFYITARIRRLRALLLLMIAAGIVATGLVYGIAQVRFTDMVDSGASAEKLLRAGLYWKVIHRQSMSAVCFNNIVTKHRRPDSEARPFYFLSAIVPRALWPEKPVLSRGDEYARLYCGSTAPPEAPHYELITLLGEPVMEGGVTGLVAAQGFLAVALTLVTLGMLRGGPVTLIAIVALLPWLIHFQQSFALYFANAVKMFIYMLPAIALLWWWTRRGDDPEATGG